MSDVDPLLSDRDQGRSASAIVKLPAVFLIALAGLGVIYALMNMVVTPDLSSLTAEQRDAIEPLLGTPRYVITAGMLVVNALVVLGAVKMLNVASRGLAIMACILSFVNLPCCCVAFPFGIWGLMVLNDETVKAGFERAATPDF